MHIHKFTAAFTLLFAATFAAVSLLVRPVWAIIQERLDTTFPLMPVAGAVAVLVCLYAAYVRFAAVKRSARPWLHTLALWLCSLLLLGGWAFLIDSLGTEKVLIGHMLRLVLPYVLFGGALALVIWLAPAWPPLRQGWLRGLIIAGFILVALLWLIWPPGVKITTPPAVFISQEGLNIIWETNLRSANRLEYGNTPQLGQSITPQQHGLRSLGDRLQNISLPLQPLAGEVYFKVVSQGVHSTYPIDFARGGQAESETLKLSLPQPGAALSWAAFSDLHEQTSLVRQLAGHIPWQNLDFVVYLGDLLNSTTHAGQVAQSILGIPNGGRLLPHLYARGNHEPRGPAGRSASDWLLPPGTEWYFTTRLGDIFFIVLNSGEDDLDSHSKYAGLVNFAAYHQQQAAWLAEVFASAEYRRARVRIVLMHIPPFTASPEYAPEFQPVLNLLLRQENIDLVMSGHTHEPGIFLRAETGLPFPVTVCGGSKAEDMAAVLARYSLSGLQLQLIDLRGNVLEHVELPLN